MRWILRVIPVVVAIIGVGVLTTPSHEVIPTAAATPVPEPSSLMVMAAGLGLAALYRKVRNHK